MAHDSSQNSPPFAFQKLRLSICVSEAETFTYEREYSSASFLLVFHAIGFALALKPKHRIGRRGALTVPRVGGLLEILQVEVVELDLLTFWSLRASAASKTPKLCPGTILEFWTFWSLRPPGGGILA